MIEQQNNLLLISFPTPEAAAQAKRWMEVAVLPWLPMVSRPASEISGPPFDPSPPPLPASPEPVRSRHVVLTDERLEQLSKQRESGQTRHQRLLKAQATLRDGTLPFRVLEQPPQPSGQASPREKAQREGGFADGLPQAAALRPQADGAVPLEAGRKRSRLRPVPLSLKPSPS
jgi:hypothetical protein